MKRVTKEFINKTNCLSLRLVRNPSEKKDSRPWPRSAKQGGQAGMTEIAMLTEGFFD
jgi:hypothetical protein